MDKLHYIESLIEKFLEGRTTNAEERELYAWFATADVPKEWSDLKAMFAWYAEGMPEQKATAQPKPRIMLRHRWWVAATTAAAACAAIVVILFPSRQTDSSKHSYNIYEGSYIVEAGVCYDDIEVIEDDIEDLFARAELIELEANELIAWADTNF